MSVQAISWALSYPVESSTEKAVLLVLANYADGDGECFPGQESIAQQAACSDRTVRRVLEAFEAKGLIARQERRRRDGSRTSDAIVLLAFQQAANLSGSGAATGQRVQPTGQSVQTNRTPCPPLPDTVSGLTTFEPSEDTSEEIAAAACASANDANHCEPVVCVEGTVVDAGGDDWPQGQAMDWAMALVRAAKTVRLDVSRQPGLVTTMGRLAAWKRDGASWEHDVLPVVTSLAQRTGTPISTWKFFDAAIAQSIADNRKALIIPEANHAGDDHQSANRANRERSFTGAGGAAALVAARGDF